MKLNWKTIVMYVLRLAEMVITGAAGGAVVSMQ